MHAPLHLGALVLAAGAGSRFSSTPGAKLVADLDGRPLLEHVIEAVRAFGPQVTVVVLGHAAEAVEGSVDWRDEIRVVNPTPERGLASSLQVGIRALATHPVELDGVFIVLGDQPRLRREVMARLAEAALAEAALAEAASVPLTGAAPAAPAAPADAAAPASERPIIVPRYVDEPGPRNPVLLLRPAWGLVDSLEGDHGLATLIETTPELVHEVTVKGSMPDVDKPADLARAWPTNRRDRARDRRD